MKNKIILIFLTGFLLGCGKMSPEAKSDLSIFYSKLGEVIECLKSGPDTAQLIASFNPVLDYWNSIKNNHHYPRRTENRINSSMYYIKLMMTVDEWTDGIDARTHLSAEEYEAEKELWRDRLQEDYDQIHAGYWKDLEEKHQEKDSPEEECELIRLMSNKLPDFKGLMEPWYAHQVSVTAWQLMLEEIQEQYKK